MEIIETMDRVKSMLGPGFSDIPREQMIEDLLNLGPDPSHHVDSWKVHHFNADYLLGFDGKQYKLHDPASPVGRAADAAKNADIAYHQDPHRARMFSG